MNRRRIIKKKGKFTILGERNSGTNYLEKIIKNNYHLDATWEYGWKHFFGFSDYSNQENVYFFGIVRNFKDWANSTFQRPYHLQRDLRSNPENYLNLSFWSYFDEYRGPNTTEGEEILEDRNMYTKERYKNIFESRETKLKFLIDEMPKKVNNYILIKYEDLLGNFDETMVNIEKTLGLTRKNKELINFPKPNSSLSEIITKDMILNNENYKPVYESILYPNFC
jgi:hypothetical protein